MAIIFLKISGFQKVNFLSQNEDRTFENFSALLHPQAGCCADCKITIGR